MYSLALPRKTRPMPLVASPDGEYALGWGRARSGSRGLRDSHRPGTAAVRNAPDSTPVMSALFTTTSARRISRASTSQSFLLLNIDAQEAAAGFVRHRLPRGLIFIRRDDDDACRLKRGDRTAEFRRSHSFASAQIFDSTC